MTTELAPTTKLSQISKDQFMDYFDLFNNPRIHLRLVILTCIRQGIGELWKLQVTEDSYAIVLRTDVISALAGDASGEPELYTEFLDKMRRHTMIFTDDDRWIELVKAHFGFRYIRRKDMRFSFNEGTLSLDHLHKLKDKYEDKYDYSKVTIRRIRPEDSKHMSDYLMGYFEIFSDREKFSKVELCHVAVDIDGKVLSIAGTDSEPIDGHYEVQIATEPDARRKGLGMIVTITHLIYALEQGLWPHWDAASKVSADIADKLGYADRTPYDIHVYTTTVIQLLRISRIPKLIIWVLRKLSVIKD